MVNVFELAQLTKELVTSSPEGCLSVSAPFKLTECGGDRLASQFAAGAELEVTSPLSCEATAANPCGAARKHLCGRPAEARAAHWPGRAWVAWFSSAAPRRAPALCTPGVVVPLLPYAPGRRRAGAPSGARAPRSAAHADAESVS